MVVQQRNLDKMTNVLQ